MLLNKTTVLNLYLTLKLDDITLITFDNDALKYPYLQ